MRIAGRLDTGAITLTCAVIVAGFMQTVTIAGPINTDAALAPGEGATILRLQYLYAESDGQDRIAHVNTSTLRTTLVYGVRKDLALFLSVPLINRQVDVFDRNMGRTEQAHDGIGDVTVMAKYRFWYEDPDPETTMRLAAIFGLNVRSGDSDFSSDSYDPIVGVVYSYRRGRNKFDADLIYQLNTGGGEHRHNSLRYDASYSFRLTPATFDSGDQREWDVVAEINGAYRTDGAHTLYLAPGIQYITDRWIFETSFQIPVTQDGDEPELDYRVTTGFRFQW